MFHGLAFPGVTSCATTILPFCFTEPHRLSLTLYRVQKPCKAVWNCSIDLERSYCRWFTTWSEPNRLQGGYSLVTHTNLIAVKHSSHSMGVGRLAMLSVANMAITNATTVARMKIED